MVKRLLLALDYPNAEKVNANGKYIKHLSFILCNNNI